ncbi:MAG: response regulator [Agriterribacter sp.]
MNELKILYLEDSAYDVELAGRILKKAGVSFNFRVVDTREEYLEALGDYTPDVILADHSLFQFNSSEALRLFKSAGLKIPFILVTGTVSEEFAVNILKEGADDYLLKSNLVRLPSAILNSINKHRFERENQQHLERTFANEALMKSAEQLAQFGSWQYRINNGGMHWSEGVYRILGYQRGTVAARHSTIAAHIVEEDKEKYEYGVVFQTVDQPSFSGELRMKNTADVIKHVFFQVRGTFNEVGIQIAQLGFMQDVTEKRRLENELASQALAQQKLMTQITIQAQEQERKLLGRELHDNVNQILTGSKIYLRLANESQDDAKRKEFIKQTFQHINNAVSEIRKLSKSLVAPTLGDMGLEPALKELAAEINLGQKLNVTVINENPDSWNADEQLELMFYRIAQEQLNNIQKHANASEATLTMNADETQYYFSVRDNGIGFNPSDRVKGIGLRNIASRVGFYSGKMNIVSAPGQGCLLDISIAKQ